MDKISFQIESVNGTDIGKSSLFVPIIRTDWFDRKGFLGWLGRKLDWDWLGYIKITYEDKAPLHWRTQEEIDAMAHILLDDLQPPPE